MEMIDAEEVLRMTRRITFPFYSFLPNISSWSDNSIVGHFGHRVHDIQIGLIQDSYVLKFGIKDAADIFCPLRVRLWGAD